MCNTLVDFQVSKIYDRLKIETKIKNGAESMLHLYHSQRDADALKNIQFQLNTATERINLLHKELDRYKAVSDSEFGDFSLQLKE